MQNSTQFYNSYLKSSDIFDFLDNVSEIKASQRENDFDILDIVELYLDFCNENDATLSRMSFASQPCEAGKMNTLSRMSTMSTMSKGYEWQNEDYLEIYEERLAICQYNGNLSEEEAKKNAISDVENQYLKQNQNSNNLKNFLIDFNDFIKSKTIQ